MVHADVASKLNVLCVFPADANAFASYKYAFRFFPKTRAFMPPQGILTIASYLPKNWNVRFVDESVRPVTDADIMDADVVMVSGMHSQRELLLELEARTHRHGKLIVLGGPSVSGSPELYSSFDIIHIGELGDATDQLIEILDKSTQRPDKQIVLETKTKLAMDDFPLPAYHLIDGFNYLALNVQWSTGCPFTCEFCDIPALYGRVPRYKSPERLIAELDALLELNSFGGVFFVDDNLIGNKKAFKQLLPHLIAWQKRTGYRLRLTAECTLNLAQDREMLGMMREAYFTDLYFGIESPNPDALVAMDKDQNVRMPIREAIKIINSYGILLYGGFILGLDTDTDSTVEEIVNFVTETQIPILTLSMLYAPPRSPLWNRLEQEGRLIPREEVIDSNVRYKIPVEEVRERWREVHLRLFEPNALYRRFQYQIDNTFPKRLDLPGERPSPSLALVLNGLYVVVSIFYQLGLRSYYRAIFWRTAIKLIRMGKLDLLIFIGSMSYHLIHYRDEVAAGRAMGSLHTEAPGKKNGGAVSNGPATIPTSALLRQIKSEPERPDL